MTKVEGEIVGLYFKSEDFKAVIPADFLTFDKPGIFGDRGRMDIRARLFVPGNKLDLGLNPQVERRITTQWSAIDFEELSQYATRKNFNDPLRSLVPRLRAILRYRDLEGGINLCIGGFSDLTQLPRGTRLHFAINERLLNDVNPGPVILEVEEHEDILLEGKKVLKGIAGIVHQTGKVVIGSKVTAEIPIFST